MATRRGQWVHEGERGATHRMLQPCRSPSLLTEGGAMRPRRPLPRLCQRRPRCARRSNTCALARDREVKTAFVEVGAERPTDQPCSPYPEHIGTCALANGDGAHAGSALVWGPRTSRRASCTPIDRSAERINGIYIYTPHSYHTHTTTVHERLECVRKSRRGRLLCPNIATNVRNVPNL